MNIRAICEGEFNLPLQPAAALPLFTPEGERSWAGSSWNPVYAIQDAASDDSAPGTVFTTEGDGATAIWIVLERRDDRMTYARVTPDRIAGTITVTCSQEPSAEATRVTVRYDVTSLGTEGSSFVRELEAGYDAFLDEWRREILAGLARRHVGEPGRVDRVAVAKHR